MTGMAMSITGVPASPSGPVSGQRRVLTTEVHPGRERWRTLNCDRVKGNPGYGLSDAWMGQFNQCIRSYWYGAPWGSCRRVLRAVFVWGKARPASSLFVLLFCTLRGTVVLRQRRD